MDIWIIDATTESGDDYIFVFDYPLTDSEAEDFLRASLPEEYEYVGHVNYSIISDHMVSKK